jgi:hypothetical protein
VTSAPDGSSRQVYVRVLVAGDKLKMLLYSKKYSTQVFVALEEVFDSSFCNTQGSIRVWFFSTRVSIRLKFLAFEEVFISGCTLVVADRNCRLMLKDSMRNLDVSGACK